MVNKEILSTFQFISLNVCKKLHVVLWVPCFHFGKTIDEKCTYTEMMVQFKKNGCLLILRSKVSLCFLQQFGVYLYRRRKNNAPAPEQQDNAHSQWWRSSAFAVYAHVCAVHLREHSPVAILHLRLPMRIPFSSLLFVVSL